MSFRPLRVPQSVPRACRNVVEIPLQRGRGDKLREKSFLLVSKTSQSFRSFEMTRLFMQPGTSHLFLYTSNLLGSYAGNRLQGTDSLLHAQLAIAVRVPILQCITYCLNHSLIQIIVDQYRHLWKTGLQLLPLRD